MDDAYRHLLYKNSPITLLESYLAIEKFLLETRISLMDQYKLFDLLKKLLPTDENHLTRQGFLSWLVWRVDQHEEQRLSMENEQPNKRKRISRDERERHTESSSLVQYTQREFEHTMNTSSDLQEKLDGLQSIVLRLASNIDTLNQQSNIRSSSPINSSIHVKHEYIENNEPSEHEHEDETSDATHPVDFPASTSTNLVYPVPTVPTKSIMYKGRNMMKHLRPRTTLTSFARHVASDLFSREEIMAKLHVDHNSERDIFLRHCICTAWNLSEQELYVMWPKIRNALLQLRRDAIAGKCIRMNGKRQQQQLQQSQQQQQSGDSHIYNSDYDDDESQK